ncbi:toll/interleukin-1 receptor domain-containing protein, partial [Candidatus Protofrankia californiensis]|uniref:toll/interleukin-1 receptor domain-containing protein n=1 Tax=Candidatus Protofrankia californiensis TaxID=1839754 RepID=UPI00104143BD
METVTITTFSTYGYGSRRWKPLLPRRFPPTALADTPTVAALPLAGQQPSCSEYPARHRRSRDEGYDFDVCPRQGECMIDDVGAGAEYRPRVFISYAHESDAHAESVRELYWFLCSRGIDAKCDLPASQRRQDWALWMEQQIHAADFILMIASPAYRRRAGGDAAADDGRGVQWEAGQIRDVIYRDQQAGLRRVLPVVLPGATTDDIPLFLRPSSTTHYRVDAISDAGLEALLRVLLGQPLEIEPVPGNRPSLPPRPGPGAIRVVAGTGPSVSG